MRADPVTPRAPSAPPAARAPVRYDALAIDLDGTLLDPRQRVSPANLEALRRARAAGLRVVICTGRGLVECIHILQGIEQLDPVVVAGGSMLACPVTRRTLHRFNLDRALVLRATERLLGHGYPVMVLKDSEAAGYDYLLVIGPDEHPLDPVTAWWFDELDVRVRTVRSIAEDEHPEHSVRVGVCGLSGRLDALTRDLELELGAGALMHHFSAVAAPHLRAQLPPGQSVNILEVFDRRATKWSAVRWLASGWGIAPERIAAIGDEINDLSMIREAGLGVAMGNAVPAVRAAAARQTRSHDEDGVAHAIGSILDGLW